MSGSFWKFSNGFASLSSITTLLECHHEESDGLPIHARRLLFKLLDEEDLLQELLSNNPMLLEFLREPDVLRLLVDLVVHEGAVFLAESESDPASTDAAPSASDSASPSDSTSNSPPHSPVIKESDPLDDDEESLERTGRNTDYREPMNMDEDLESPEERASRKSAITAEILSADIWSLTDAVMDQTDILNVLWQVLDSPEPLSINLSSYFTKIMEHLLDMKCDDMIAYLIENQPRLVSKFMNHITNPPLMDFLLKLISTDKPDNATGIIDFLQRQGLIPNLIAALDLQDDVEATNTEAATTESTTESTESTESTPESTPESTSESTSESTESTTDNEQALLRQSSAADFLKALITISANSATDNSTIGPNELTRELVSAEQMSSLCRIMLKGRYSLANGVGIIIEIIRKNNSDYDVLPVLYITLGSHPPTGRDPIYLGHLLKVFGGKIDEFNQLLMDQMYSDASRKLKTPFGEIEPLGFERFKICELVAELLHCSNMALLNDNKGYDVVAERDALREKMKAFDPNSFKYNEVIVMPVEEPEEPEDPENSQDLDVDGKEDLKDESASTDSKTLDDTDTDAHSFDENAGAQYNDTIDSFNSKLNGDESSLSVQQAAENDEEEPHANANLTENQIRALPVVGDFLKIHLFDTQIISNILTMFFKFPWNNFLHNVVFDIVQQVLNGSMDIGFNKFLAIDLFHLGDITNKIIDGQRLCTEYESSHNGLRLGFMGHLTLIAEEVVKFIQLYPVTTLSELIDIKVNDPVWEKYVSDVLYDTREKYNAILGGGEDEGEDEDEDEDNSTYDEGMNDISDGLNARLVLDPLADHDVNGGDPPTTDMDELDESPISNKHDVPSPASEESESDEDDDDHFTNYMSQHLNDTASAEAFSTEPADALEEMPPFSKVKPIEPLQDVDMGIAGGEDGDDDYEDPNDDGMSYKKSNPLYDGQGSLLAGGPGRNHVRDTEDFSSEDYSSSSSDNEDEVLEENSLITYLGDLGLSGSKLMRASSKGGL